MSRNSQVSFDDYLIKLKNCDICNMNSKEQLDKLNSIRKTHDKWNSITTTEHPNIVLQKLMDLSQPVNSQFFIDSQVNFSQDVIHVTGYTK
nr:9135_t:CDS:2 [Entrophospora candida]